MNGGNMDIRQDIIETCVEDPELWESIARDCIDNIDYDDIECIAKKCKWKLPRESYRNHVDESRYDVIALCEWSPDKWEDFVRECLDLLPAHFIECMSEDYEWI